MKAKGLPPVCWIALGLPWNRSRAEIVSALSQSVAKRRSRPVLLPAVPPLLDQLGVDLNRRCHGPVNSTRLIGREKEIERVIQILSRRTKNNPALIGEPVLVRQPLWKGLAHRIASGDVPETLEDKRLITLDMAGVVAGTKYRGEFEERLKKIIEEIKTAVTASCSLMSFILSWVPAQPKAPSMPPIF